MISEREDSGVMAETERERLARIAKENEGTSQGADALRKAMDAQAAKDETGNREDSSSNES